MSTVDAALLALFGVILVMAGYRLVRFLASILFAGLLGLVGFQVTLSTLGSNIIAFIAGIILFIIGAVIGFLAFKTSLSIVGGYALSSIILRVIANYKDLNILVEYHEVVLLILTIVLAAILYMVLDHLLVIGLAIVGGVLVFLSLTYWLPIIIAVPLAIILVVVGSLYQLKHIKE